MADQQSNAGYETPLDVSPAALSMSAPAGQKPNGSANGGSPSPYQGLAGISEKNTFIDVSPAYYDGSGANSPAGTSPVNNGPTPVAQTVAERA